MENYIDLGTESVDFFLEACPLCHRITNLISCIIGVFFLPTIKRWLLETKKKRKICNRSILNNLTYINIFEKIFNILHCTRQLKNV